MKNLLSFIILFIIAASVLALVQYFQKSNRVLAPINTTNSETVSTTTPIDKNPLLSSSQEAALEKAGIDPGTLPTKLTPQMEACFIAQVGINRYNQIKGGEIPTIDEIIKGKSCLTAQ